MFLINEGERNRLNDDHEDEKDQCSVATTHSTNVEMPSLVSCPAPKVPVVEKEVQSILIPQQPIKPAKTRKELIIPAHVVLPAMGCDRPQSLRRLRSGFAEKPIDVEERRYLQALVAALGPVNNAQDDLYLRHLAQSPCARAIC